MFLRSQKRSQNDVPYGGILICDDRSPVSVTDHRKVMILAQLIGGFKMAAGFKKWPPGVFWHGFLAAWAAKMATPWRIFAGR